MLPTRMSCTDLREIQEYKNKTNTTPRPHVKRANSSLSIRSQMFSSDLTELVPIRIQSDRSPGSRNSSSEPVFSFKPECLGSQTLRPRHFSSNWPGVQGGPKLPDKKKMTAIEPQPVKLVGAVKKGMMEPPPVFEYSSSEEGSPEPVITRLRKKKPRNALKLDRPRMESFNPIQTSEKINSKSVRCRKTVSCSTESLTTLKSPTEICRPTVPPPPSPRRCPVNMDFKVLTVDEKLEQLQQKTESLSIQYRDLEEETRTNTRDIGNLQEALVNVANTRNIRDTIHRVGGQATSLISELQQTQRNVVKCLSEAEQARREYDELKQKTEAILHQLQQCQLMGSLSLASRLSLTPDSSSQDQDYSKEDRNI